MANMKYSTYRVSLDLQKHQSQVSIAVFQYDTAVRLCISLTDGGNPYTIPIEDGYRAIFYGKRPDNTPLTHNCIIESDSRIIYDFQDSTAAVKGITNCQLRLYGAEGELITAPRFIIVVDERVVSEGLIELDDDQLSAIDEIFLTENGRVLAENARVVAENDRAASESLRQNFESGRLSNETLRKAAEEARVAAELEREEAETKRGKNAVLKAPVEETQTINSNVKVVGILNSTTGQFTSLSLGGKAVATKDDIAAELEGIADRLNEINNGGRV